MKNVLMTLFVLCGIGMTQMVAQTCKPSPECAKLCKGKKSCDPKVCEELIKAGKCTPAEAEACKAAMATCQPAASATTVQTTSAQPSCLPAQSVSVAQPSSMSNDSARSNVHAVTQAKRKAKAVAVRG